MAAPPLNWSSLGAEDNNFPLPYALGTMQHFQCTRHQFRCKMQHLGQGPVGPSSGYLKWSVWGWWVVGGVRACSRLRACSLPSAAPQGGLVVAATRGGRSIPKVGGAAPSKIAPMYTEATAGYVRMADMLGLPKIPEVEESNFKFTPYWYRWIGLHYDLKEIVYVQPFASQHDKPLQFTSPFQCTEII